VPGVIYSKMRPGPDHLAFRVDSAKAFNAFLTAAHENGWSSLPTVCHPIAPGAEDAYLEDDDGFEFELGGASALVAPAAR
jgi:catechol 2,3-dioxygenase-like lactoylglutathione lyase family enzyme